MYDIQHYIPLYRICQYIVLLIICELFKRGEKLKKLPEKEGENLFGQSELLPFASLNP